MRRWAMGGALAFAVAAAGISYAAVPNAAGVINACYKPFSGALRLIDAEAGAACTSKERPLAWNVQGAEGRQGRSRATGATGAAGARRSRGELRHRTGNREGRALGAAADRRPDARADRAELQAAAGLRERRGAREIVRRLGLRGRRRRRVAEPRVRGPREWRHRRRRRSRRLRDRPGRELPHQRQGVADEPRRRLPGRRVQAEHGRHLAGPTSEGLAPRARRSGPTQ